MPTDPHRRPLLIVLAAVVVAGCALAAAFAIGGVFSGSPSAGPSPTSGTPTTASSTETTTSGTTSSSHSSSHPPSHSSTSGSSGSSTSSGSPTSSHSGPVRVSDLTLEQAVGQLFMVGGPATGVGSATTDAITSRHVGSVILTGRSGLGVSGTRAISARLQSLATDRATAGLPLLIAADQEGGNVQVLRGPGFSSIPTALKQGSYSATRLRADAATWGRQLASAGVDVDLAPVVDTVPSAGAASDNPPIGYFHREFGYTTATVALHGTAFADGLRDAHVLASPKHFPGLGRVTGNTDTTAHVTDRTTTRHDAYIAPFAAAVRAGAPMLMMSTAYYSRIDPDNPAAFSSTIIGGMVRGDLGFGGVVISDDLGSAQQVAAWSPADRALKFLTAGGDMVLTVDPARLPAMYDAVLAKARASSSFRARVDDAAGRVLAAKASGILR